MIKLKYIIKHTFMNVRIAIYIYYIYNSYNNKKKIPDEFEPIIVYSPLQVTHHPLCAYNTTYLYT